MIIHWYWPAVVFGYRAIQLDVVVNVWTGPAHICDRQIHLSLGCFSIRYCHCPITCTLHGFATFHVPVIIASPFYNYTVCILCRLLWCTSIGGQSCWGFWPFNEGLAVCIAICVVPIACYLNLNMWKKIVIGNNHGGRGILPVLQK